MRRQYHIDSTQPLENAPPLVVFTTVVLGGFRGLLADVLWLRAAYLQEAGKYFELVQLSDWITKLEPHSTEIWAFHAWNMAYNISLLMPEAEDRWRWVRHGLELLRDQGLTCNPGDPRLYFELGWLYQHKIGGMSDKAHRYYKGRWATEMTDLIGGGKPDYNAWQADPATVRRLRRTYKLIPEIMQAVDTEYGPLDWRLPETHSVYWAYRGRQQAVKGSALFCNRMIFQSMTRAFWGGNLIGADDGNFVLPSPRPELLPKVMKAFEFARQEHPDVGSVNTAYANFLKEAIVTLHVFARNEDAARAYGRLRELSPGMKADPDVGAYVTNRVSRTVARTSAGDVAAKVGGHLFESLVRRCAGYRESADAAEHMAQLYWGQYMRQLTTPPSDRRRMPTFEALRRRARRRADTVLPSALRNRLPEFDGGARQ